MKPPKYVHTTNLSWGERDGETATYFTLGAGPNSRCHRPHPRGRWLGRNVRCIPRCDISLICSAKPVSFKCQRSTQGPFSPAIVVGGILNSIAFPIFVSAALGLIGMGLGCALHNLIGRPKIAVAALLVLALIPWFLHHRLLVESDVDVGIVAYFGPGIMAFAVAAAPFLDGRARLLIASIPAIGFGATWNITIPSIVELRPMNNLIPDDNMRTIWLAIWTIGTTFFLLAYALPKAGQNQHSNAA